MGSAEVPARRLGLSRNRDFRLLWIGQVLSQTGSGVASIAYPLLILAVTHSAVIAGAVGTVQAATAIALQLPGGALADRWDRRRTAVICDGTRGVVLAVLGLLILTGTVPWPAIAAVAVIDAAGKALFLPAVMTALPVIVEDEQLRQAWALTEARSYAAGLAGPALGGVLFALGRTVPFLADAVSYVVSAVTVGRLRGDFRPAASSTRGGLVSEMRDGFSYCWHSPLVRPVMLITPLSNVALVGAEYTITLALRRHGVSPGVIGLLQAVVACGGLAGAGLAATRIGRSLGLRELQLIIGLSGAILFALAAVIAPSPLFAIPIALAYLPCPAANAVLTSTVLTTVPDELRGRVLNTIGMTAMGVAALAPLAVGVLLTHTTVHITLGVLGTGLALNGLLALRLFRTTTRP
jgi:MFS family permease